MADTAGHFLENWDDFTSLYDIPGGNIINPFKAYAKSETNRQFAGLSQHTENLRVSVPGGNFSVKIAVEASYPSNCSEPYSIDNFTQQALYETTGSESQVGIDISDWQDNATGVYLYCPAITGGPLVTLTHGSGVNWTGTISNANGVNAGQYVGYIAAFSGSSVLYDLVVIQVSEAQSSPMFQDVTVFGGTQYDTVTGLVFDSDRNIYMCGNFQGASDFDPGSGEEIRDALTGTDTYLLKLDSNNNFGWVVTLGGTEDCSSRYLYIDKNQDLYILGGFKGTVDFNPGPGEEIKTSTGYFDIYLSKFDRSGVWQWTKAYGSTGFDEGYNLDSDSSGNIYISGAFNETIDFDPGSGTYNVPTKGSQDVYITKFDSDGNWQWAKAWGGTGGEYACSLVVESDNSILVSGSFEFTVDFDPGPGVTERTDTGMESVFISNFDSSGNFISVVAFGGDSSVMMSGMTDDAGFGVYVSGSFTGTVDFDPGPDIYNITAVGIQSAYICKYTNTLGYEWALSYGGTDWSSSTTLLQSSTGGIMIGGCYAGTIDFDPGTNQFLVTSNGGSDCYLLQLDSDGNYDWSLSWGGTGSDSSKSINRNNSGKLFVAGEYRETVDFDPGDGIDERTAEGVTDAFLSWFE